jgi:hypothetical protein
MDLNVKLQGLKYNFGKVQGYFCKIPRFQRFSGFTDLFSLREIRKICPRDCGPGPPASAHGSTGFIKRRSLATGSWLLISVVHHRSDGGGGWLQPGVVRACTHGGAPRPSVAAHWSSSFLEPRWSVFDEVCSYGITATRGTQLG